MRKSIVKSSLTEEKSGIKVGTVADSINGAEINLRALLAANLVIAGKSPDFKTALDGLPIKCLHIGPLVHEPLLLDIYAANNMLRSAGKEFVGAMVAADKAKLPLNKQLY